ncbi:ras GEF [Eremomyces bilateralis CBS 781.70]|uniref:Ras GEF n=1 Tax=Eremomyces bilateralis CBS 781.70 TaxID=1392243 RepID=A0A6G1FS26_9PEZI|nr:ras GEF [Eremomyces bilateralis CBS 781.70]KAF1808577.1 ras GEF [Eremomyces bilateralis CBS 781.70]
MPSSTSDRTTPSTSAGISASATASPRPCRSSSIATQLSHQRDKTKSAQPYLQDVRRQSTAQGAVVGYTGPTIGEATRVPRPTMKSRAYSAPLVSNNQSQFQDSEDDDSDGDGDNEDEEEDGNPAELGDEITGDPFFQRYNFPTSNSREQERDGVSEEKSSPDTKGPASPARPNARPRPDSVAEPLASPITPMATRRFPFEFPVSDSAQDINIAVMGEEGVGKSMFIQKAFDLRNHSNGSATSKRMPLEGDVYTVRLVELEFDDIEFDDDDRISWPETYDDVKMPTIHGALILYDVMNKESLVDVPDVLKAMHKASIPFLLVSCKCDNHPALREIDPDVVEKRAKDFIGGDVGAVQTAFSSPDSQKRCLSVIIRDILSERREKLKLSAARRRANTGSSQAQSPAQKAAAIAKHNRASSEYSATVYKARTGMAPLPAATEPFLPTKSRSHHNLPGLPTQKSFLNLEDSPSRDGSDNETSSPPKPKQVIPAEQPSNENGYSFDQLVNRFLELPLSKVDEKFKDSFLALFRLFAAPSMLLDAIIARFETVERVSEPILLRTISQQRYLTLLQAWISNYPGDFAHPLTRVRFSNFLSRVANVPIHAAAVHVLGSDLENVAEDDDTNWACSDHELGPAFPLDRSPSNTTLVSQASTLLNNMDTESVLRKPSKISLTSTDTNSSTTTLAKSASQTTLASQFPGSMSSVTLLSIVESAQKSAKSLNPLPRFTFAKIHWRLLMDTTDDVIAKELTRMDWTLISSIRTRDLVRYVSMSKAAKDKSKSTGHLPGLENVDRMSTHFNRLAAVVSNFVLLRDKPKHRALMLEKWMRVARELRKLNNYNSLGAVLAGIHSSPVHRLALTREQLPAPVAKDFMKLEILMGTAKSHFAYRLAWENSSGERIPYLPLHRRDLVTASEGNKTFVEPAGGAGVPKHGEGNGNGNGNAGNAVAELKSRRINWKKFEIMGDVIVEVQRAQAVPYMNLLRNEDVKMLVLETKISMDEDELYDRSVAVEPGGMGPSRGKFNWFQRGP